MFKLLNENKDIFYRYIYEYKHKKSDYFQRA